MLSQYGILALCLTFYSLCSAADYDARKVVAGIAAKCKGAEWWSLDGTIEVAGQRGSAPGRMLAKAKFSAARGTEGRFRLHLEPVDKDAWMLYSNGQKSWAYVPKLKSYTVLEGASTDSDADEQDGGEDDSERDLSETFIRTFIGTLGRMTENLSGIEVGSTTSVRVEGKKQTWPWLRTISKPDASGNQRIIEVAFDPESLIVGKLTVAEVTFDKNEKTVIRMSADLEKFRVGEKLPDSEFEFDPPKKSKLVETLPIPGQTGSDLLDKLAPDFELKTLEGQKLRLSELRGKPVLLNFWASWCGPCRRELPGIEKIHADLQYKGLVVLGINDEGRGIAKKFATTNGLTFETLDDSAGKTHALYRVKAIPAVFLIDAEGKIVKFFRGAQEESTLRSALQKAGIAK